MAIHFQTQYSRPKVFLRIVFYQNIENINTENKFYYRRFNFIGFQKTYLLLYCTQFLNTLYQIVLKDIKYSRGPSLLDGYLITPM